MDPQYLATLLQRQQAGLPLTDGERAVLLQAQMQQRQTQQSRGGLLDMFDAAMRQQAPATQGQAVAAVRG